MYFKRTLLIASLLLSCSSAKAVWINDLNKNDIEQFLPEKEGAVNLDEEVNLSFHETSLSHVLLLLSKVSGLNVIFPDDLDQKISIQLRNKRAVDAIKDVIEINNLKYVFDGKTFNISHKDKSTPELKAFNIIYSEAREITRRINDDLFTKMIFNQEAGLPEPHAFTPPNKNSVIVSGTEEQIKEAEKLIKLLDTKPEISFYDPSYLSVEESALVLDKVLDNPSLRLRQEDELLIIKGLAEEAEEAKKILAEYDVPNKTRTLNLEIYLLPNTLAKNADNNGLNGVFPKGSLIKLSKETKETEIYKEIKYKIEKLYSENITINNEKEFHEIPIEASNSIASHDHFNLSFSNQDSPYTSKEETLAFRTKLKALKKLRKELKLKAEDEILILIRTVS